MAKIIDFKTGKEIKIQEEQPEIKYDLQDYYNGQILDLIRCLMVVINIPEENQNEFNLLLGNCLETIQKIIENKNGLRL